MGPVERAVRARLTAPTTLYTHSRRSPFELARIDDAGIVLLLGAKRAWTPLRWECLEGVVPFMQGHGGWIAAGGTYKVERDHGTLDEHLKGCLSRSTSRWVAVVREKAGVIHIRAARPLEIRLTSAFGGDGTSTTHE